MMELGEQFIKALQSMEGEFDTNEKNHLAKTPENTARVMQALRSAASDCGDVALLMLICAACDCAPIPEKGLTSDN